VARLGLAGPYYWLRQHGRPCTAFHRVSEGDTDQAVSAAGVAQLNFNGSSQPRLLIQYGAGAPRSGLLTAEIGQRLILKDIKVRLTTT